ncbi:MAG: hypothetical protein AABW79_00140 [Nanoarchaeota archaeon]
MPKEDLVKKLSKVHFGKQEIKWHISPRRGERMPYAENEEAYFFKMSDTGTIIVQPKSPSSAMPHCFSCNGNIITIVRDVYTRSDNGESPGSPFYQEWIKDTFPVALPYCKNCDPKPEGGQRFSSVEEFHRVYGKNFIEILPTRDALIKK